MPSINNRIRVVSSVTNCICYDQRVLKISETVMNMGCDIKLIGINSGDCCKTDKVQFKTKRFKMLFKRGFLFYKFFNIRLFLHLLFHNYDILVSNDLDTLLPNYLISRLKKIPLIYDSHEYFTGVPEIQNRPFVKWVWKTIERSVLPKLKYVMTVSDSIAGQYKSEYGVIPVTVRNCSRSAGEITGYTRKDLGISEDNLVLILQGSGINIDRGGEELMEAISMTDNVCLLIVGSGDVLDNLKSMATELEISDRVKFISKIPWEDMMRYTKSADAGLSLDKDTNQNYKYSLPNKLFDYLSAGIPVITSNLPEVSKIVKDFDCGLIIEKVTPGNISESVSVLRDNNVKRADFKKNAEAVSEVLNWETESGKVKDLYDRVLAGIIDR